MLVLSRRPDQRVVFPNLGITIQLLRIKGNTARLGIEAPPEVAILRDEIAQGAKAPAAQAVAEAAAGDERSKWRHVMRNRLNAATLALHLLKRQWEAGKVEQAEATFAKVLDELTELEAFAQGAVRMEMPGADPVAKAASRRALLVEDDRNESELLAGYLRMSGFNVDTAGDGADALRYLASQSRPDVVLLDMMMPRFDGPSTIKAIRENATLCDLKVFAISGSAPDDLGVAIGRGGVDRWFGKPLDPAQLVSAMSQEIAPADAT